MHSCVCRDSSVVIVGAWSAEHYARVAVAEVLRARPKAWRWAGQNSGLVWFMDTFLGRRAFVRIFLTARYNDHTLTACFIEGLADEQDFRNGDLCN